MCLKTKGCFLIFKIEYVFKQVLNRLNHVVVSCLNVTSYFWPHFAILGCSRAHADWRRSTRRSAKCTWYQLCGGEPHSGMCWLSWHFLGVAFLFKVFKKTPSFYSLSNCYLEINRFSSRQGGVRTVVISCVAPCHTLTCYTFWDGGGIAGLWLAACLTPFPFWNTLVPLWFLTETSVFYFESCSLRSKAQVL